jgi:hypothetical protein
MSNPEYLFDKYEEDAEFMLGKMKQLRVSAARWREVADLLMSRDPSENGLGRRMYAALTDAEQ